MGRQRSAAALRIYSNPYGCVVPTATTGDDVPHRPPLPHPLPSPSPGRQPTYACSLPPPPPRPTAVATMGRPRWQGPPKPRRWRRGHGRGSTMASHVPPPTPPPPLLPHSSFTPAPSQRPLLPNLHPPRLDQQPPWPPHRCGGNAHATRPTGQRQERPPPCPSGDGGGSDGSHR